MLFTDIQIPTDAPEKAFVKGWNLIVSHHLRHAASFHRIAMARSDILVRYRANEMIRLLSEVGRIETYAYELSLRVLDHIELTPDGKLTVIFLAGTRITNSFYFAALLTAKTVLQTAANRLESDRLPPIFSMHTLKIKCTPPRFHRGRYNVKSELFLGNCIYCFRGEPIMNSYTDCENYSVNLPYPSVVIHERNTYYAALLSDAFAGPGSETTALTQYTAHNFYTLDYPEITNAYRCILSVENIHLNLLGNLIRDLGLHPIFMTYQTMQYWNGSFPEYASDIKQILLSDIAGENAAIAHYTQLISQINNPDIQALISRIILDEKKHVEILTSFYRGLIDKG